MPQKFRLTCARTTYFDVELSAESIAEAERVLEGMLRVDPRIPERSRLGRPVDRVVEVEVQTESAGVFRDAAA
jgi:hypothetical protein